jgi:hypothetical protein
MATAAGCNAGNCTVVDMLKATNETYAACGVPIRDKTNSLIGPVASVGSLALIMVVLRLIDRAVSAQAQLGLDDLLIGLSGVCTPQSFVTILPHQPVNTLRTVADRTWFTVYVPRDERASHHCRYPGLW